MGDLLARILRLTLAKVKGLGCVDPPDRMQPESSMLLREPNGHPVPRMAVWAYS